MGQQARWEKIAREWNGKYYPPKGLLRRGQKVVAAKDGYLAMIGTMVRDGGNVAYVAVRFPRGGSWQSLPEAVMRDQAVLKTLGKETFPRMLRKRLKVEEGLLWFDRPYYFRSNPEQLAALAGALVALLPARVQRFSGRCEVCDSIPVGAPVLVNGSPAYVCAGCLETQRQEEARTERAYAAQASRPALGLLTGTGAALVGGLGWAALAVFTDHIYSAVAIGMGAVVAYAVKVGMGKVNLPGQILTGLLTLGSVFAGQVFYVAHLIQQRSGSYNLPIALQAYLEVLREEPASEGITFLFALLGVGVALSAMKRPKFQSTLERT